MASGSKKVIIAALIGNSLIAVTKFIASSITGSSAMFSEGIHSLVDTGNQGLLLYGLKTSQKPPSKDFPFGHGKEIYFWSFIVSILIFALGAGISIYEGVHHIIHPEEIKSPIINYIVLSLAIIFEGGALYIAFKEFNKARGTSTYLNAVKDGKDPTLFVVLFEDSAAMLGLFIALAGVTLAQVTGNAWWDGVASVSIGIVLALTAIWLAIETKSLLIGEAASEETVESIRKMANDKKEINAVHEILTLHMGPEFILVNISLHFKKDIAAHTLAKLIDELVNDIKQAHPRIKRVFVEAEPLKELGELK
ncbi:MAG: cation diffusion facilitator family transporter [Bdellovibrionales bacterium]